MLVPNIIKYVLASFGVTKDCRLFAVVVLLLEYWYLFVTPHQISVSQRFRVVFYPLLILGTCRTEGSSPVYKAHCLSINKQLHAGATKS